MQIVGLVLDMELMKREGTPPCRWESYIWTLNVRVFGDKCNFLNEIKEYNFKVAGFITWRNQPIVYPIV